MIVGFYLYTGALKITTPLRVERWKEMHPDEQYIRYILDGIKHEFRFGFNGNKSAGLQSATSNMQSASVHHIVITEYLCDECMKGRITGPFSSSDTQGVRFGVLPQKSQPGKWRLIVDLLYPNEASASTQQMFFTLCLRRRRC